MARPPSSTLIDRRREQMFPVLAPAQVESARRFGGAPQRFEAAQTICTPGKMGSPAFLMLSGSIEIVRRDGLGHSSVITTHGPNEFTGELSQLAGGPSMIEARAGPEGCMVVPFNAAQLRALIVGNAEVGEILMRAFILRRVHLIESGSGTVVVGRADSADALRLQNFMRRNGIPHTLLDPRVDAEAQQLVERLGVAESELPLALCPDGTVLRKPTEGELAKCLGFLRTFSVDEAYDVAIVGAGPAGLATAVYATSEGLSVLVLEARAFGGQAGASARIENYLGFPTGISGQALAGRAFTQAQKFGAVMAIPTEVSLLRCARQGSTFELKLNDDQQVCARAVVIASGARYRRPDIPNLSMFEGHGIYYWASPLEAKLCINREVIVVGGGNSAGQGAVFLASHASKVHILVRGRDLSASMSRYLIDRIAVTPNIEVHTETELTQLIGSAAEGLQAVRWRKRQTGEEEKECPIRQVFLFVGADPNAEWLKECAIAVDANGFVQTGDALAPGRGDGSGKRRLALETSQQGVFAVGDVRAGSVKRVASAVGEGAAVVAQIHGYLEELDKSRSTQEKA